MPKPIDYNSKTLSAKKVSYHLFDLRFSYETIVKDIADWTITVAFEANNINCEKQRYENAKSLFANAKKEFNASNRKLTNADKRNCDLSYDEELDSDVKYETYLTCEDYKIVCKNNIAEPTKALKYTTLKLKEAKADLKKWMASPELEELNALLPLKLKLFILEENSATLYADNYIIECLLSESNSLQEAETIRDRDCEMIVLHGHKFWYLKADATEK